jgi:hypothetical protein
LRGSESKFNARKPTGIEGKSHQISSSTAETHKKTPRAFNLVADILIILIVCTDKRLYAYMTKNIARDFETTRLTITWSREADHALRTFLGSQGMKKGDLSKFIEEAVRWRIFHQTVRQARAAFADVSPDKLQNMIDEAVEDARAKHYRKRAQRS